MSCLRCKGGLGEEHYLQPVAKGNKRPICVACYDNLMAPRRFTTTQAVLRTFAFSGLAAVLCGFLAALPIALLTWNTAIVWIFLGAVMGRAVVRASDDRGDWYYRLIGLGSTWCAIGLSWLFCFVIWMWVPPKETDDKGPISNTALVSMLKPGTSPTPSVSATPSASATPGASPAVPTKDEKPPNPAAVVLVVGLLSLLVIVGAPIFVAIASPISVLIYLYALHTTWKTSARESRDLEKVGSLTEPEKTDLSRPDGAD